MAMTPSLNRLLAFKVRHAAEDGRVIVCRCSRCKTATAFWAADLVAVGHGEESVMEYDRWCGKCQSYNWTRTYAHLPGPNDVGRFQILRPAGIQQTQIWQKQWFENPPPALQAGDVMRSKT